MADRRCGASAQHVRLRAGRSEHAGDERLQVIELAKELSPETEAVMLTGKSTLDTAVAALRQGVFDYLTKPCKLAELESLLSRIARNAN
jgi:DNA-binding NtrC family response regulator